MVQAEVQKSGNESALSTIRKFSRRVQGAGLVKTLRSKRYHSRDVSRAVKKKRALKLIKRRADFRQMIKEGKIAEPQRRGQFTRDRQPAPRPATGSGLGENTPIAR
ncbi:MAG: hypothetical protein RIQ56_176 [Candidatus Parcubacteria bacterium]|jgi:ribosomal protein S21